MFASISLLLRSAEFSQSAKSVPSLSEWGDVSPVYDNGGQLDECTIGDDDSAASDTSSGPNTRGFEVGDFRRFTHTTLGHADKTAQSPNWGCYPSKWPRWLLLTIWDGPPSTLVVIVP